MTRSTLAAALTLAGASTLGAQAPTDTTAAPAPAADTAVWIAVHDRPRSTVMGVTVTFPTGSAQDPAGRGGTAWLLAGTLEAMAAQALGPGVSVRVQVDRNRFHATLLAPPDDWDTALRTLTTVMFRRELDDDAFQTRRARLLSRLSFEAGAPVREFELEAARLYADGRSEWARMPEGDPESLQAVTLSDLQQYRRRHLSADDAVLALVGPAGAGAAAAAASALGGRGGSGLGSTAAGTAWMSGERVVETREITNTAIAVAYPLPADATRTEAEFLAHVLDGRLNLDPPDPGVYSITARVLDTPSGPVLAVEAVVFPEVGPRWESEIARAVRDTEATASEEDVYFPWQHRRFRSHSLDADAAPEDLGRRLNDDLLRQSGARDVNQQVTELTSARLAALAGSLGEPRILVYGPDQSAQQDR